MYLPPAFRLDDGGAWAFVGMHDFGLLLSHRHGAIDGTHLPLRCRERGGRRALLAHLARANPQWRSLEGAPVTVIFEGPHGYVSPTWYADGANAVPTWNYTAVHVRGTARLGNRDDLIEQLEGTAAAHEAAAADGTRWHVGRLSAEQRERLFAAIVPVVVDVERIEGKAKLSQNRSAADRDGVIAALEARGDAGSLALALAMRAAATPGPAG